MADISMCSNRACPSAENCYRFRAIANPHWQTYADFHPSFQGRCDWFVHIDRYGQVGLTPFVKEEEK